MFNDTFVNKRVYIVRVHCQFLHHIMIPKSTSATRVRGVLIVKKLNKCILNILVYNLFLDRQYPAWYLNN